MRSEMNEFMNEEQSLHVCNDLLVALQSGYIRTIIKARGLRHPNFYGHKTFAVFRADKDHNLVSVVSKIGRV
jgi:hypothetical protein